MEIRVAQDPAHWAIAHRMLDEERLLGAGLEASDRSGQFVLEDGHRSPCWCGAPLGTSRIVDEQIGFDAVTP